MRSTLQAITCYIFAACAAAIPTDPAPPAAPAPASSPANETRPQSSDAVQDGEETPTVDTAEALEAEDCGPEGLYCPSDLADEEQKKEPECATEYDCWKVDAAAKVRAELDAQDREEQERRQKLLDSGEPDYVPANETFGGSSGHPRCSKGKPCGRSCIARDKVCHVD